MSKQVLKIGGINYNIVVKKVDSTIRDIVGVCDRSNNTIYLLSDISKENTFLTLIHEIIHGINGELSEEVVDGLAFGLHQVLTDNKDFFIEKLEGK